MMGNIRIVSLASSREEHGRKSIHVRKKSEGMQTCGANHDNFLPIWSDTWEQEYWAGGWNLLRVYHMLHLSLQSRLREIKTPEVCSMQEPDALVMAQYAWHRSNRSVVADGLDPSDIWRTIWNMYRHEVERGTPRYWLD